MGAYSRCCYHVYWAPYAYGGLGDDSEWLGNFLCLEFV